MTRPPFPHSYIGIQPAKRSQPLNYEERAPGIHHIALWARSKREVDRFYHEFLMGEQVSVTDPPESYPHYAPGYYAVFFLDPTGIRWELAYLPRIPYAMGDPEITEGLEASAKPASRVEATSALRGLAETSLV